MSPKLKTLQSRLGPLFFGSRVRKVTCFSISLNLELLFCKIFDCKE